jgi:hypothetical protein
VVQTVEESQIEIHLSRFDICQQVDGEHIYHTESKYKELTESILPLKNASKDHINRFLATHGFKFSGEFQPKENATKKQFIIDDL